jgi:hypothetical protein
VIAVIVNIQQKWALAESRQKWDESDRLVGWLRPVQYFKDRMAELRWLLQQVAKKQVRPTSSWRPSTTAKRRRTQLSATTSKRRLYSEYSTLVLALLDLDQSKEGLAALRARLACAPTASDLYYALQDLLILARAPRAMPGLNEAIQVLRKEWEAGGGLRALATVFSENAPTCGK